MRAQQRGKMGGGRGMSSRDTERIERRIRRGRVEVGGNVEVFEGWGRGPVCRKGSGLRRNGLTEPGTRGGCADGNKAH